MCAIPDRLRAHGCVTALAAPADYLRIPRPTEPGRPMYELLRAAVPVAGCEEFWDLSDAVCFGLSSVLLKYAQTRATSGTVGLRV